MKMSENAWPGPVGDWLRTAQIGVKFRTFGERFTTARYNDGLGPVYFYHGRDRSCHAWHSFGQPVVRNISKIFTLPNSRPRPRKSAEMTDFLLGNVKKNGREMGDRWGAQGGPGGQNLGPISSSPLRVQDWASGPPITTHMATLGSTMVPKAFSNSAPLKSY